MLDTNIQYKDACLFPSLRSYYLSLSYLCQHFIDANSKIFDLHCVIDIDRTVASLELPNTAIPFFLFFFKIKK